MTETIAESRPSGRVIGMACVAALAFGVVFPVAPKAAIAAIVLVPIAFAAPVAALSTLLAVTILVPFDVQDSLAVVGGRDQPGLLVVDALLVLGLVRVTWLVARGRYQVDRRVVAGVAVAVIVTAGLAWGLVLGNEMSEAGHEARRVILGVGAFLLALPLVDDRAARRRIAMSLMAIGAALALWGLAQWVLSVGYTTSGDVGVRPGVELTGEDHGQLQGGMYAFPIAVILSWAALLSGRVRDMRAKSVLTVILALNAVCLLLTFERTLWVATAAACAVLAMTSGAATRRLAFRWAGVAAVVTVMMAAAAPETAHTAIDRLLSIAQFSSDTSYTARVVESQAVIDTILQRPATGSGFGATLTWGLNDVFGTQTTPFVHNGYLWLAWKIGIVAVVLLVALIAATVLRGSGDEHDPQWHLLRRGSQAAVLALLLTSVTFPVFNALGITALMGFLVAVCVSRDSAEVLT